MHDHRLIFRVQSRRLIGVMEHMPGLLNERTLPGWGRKSPLLPLVSPQSTRKERTSLWSRHIVHGGGTPYRYPWTALGWDGRQAHGSFSRPLMQLRVISMPIN